MRVQVTLAIILAVFMVNLAPAEEPVHFADARLKDAVERELSIMDPTPTDMLGLTDLTCVQDWDGQDQGITDLTGLEYAENLQDLNLRLNRISSISALSGLMNLRSLNLSENEISDLSPLSGLVDLEYVNLHANEISNLSPLSGMDKADALILRFNQISSLSGIGGMTALRDLDLGSNEISDISALSGLTHLSTLSCWSNEISDISALSGLTNLGSLDLDMNQIDDIAAFSGLSDLRNLDLQSNRVSDLSPLSGLANLRYLDLDNNRISDIAALSGLPSLRRVELEGNLALNDEAYCTDLETLHGQGVALCYTPNNDPPAGLRASVADYLDGIEITWDPVCSGPVSTSYYRVSRCLSEYGVPEPVGDWQTARRFEDVTAEPGVAYYYCVQTDVSSQGQHAGDYSQRVMGQRHAGFRLTIASTAGGAVTMPGEGLYEYDGVTTLTVRAIPIKSAPYFFRAWTGTAVDAGKVAVPDAPYTTVALDKAYSLTACFVTTMSTIHVDAAAAHDPAPGDAGASDAQENGTAAHPFDSIQEAIDVADEGASILVRPGTYYETIGLCGKGIHVTGIDPNNPNQASYPILDGGGEGPVVSFVKDEGPNCALSGFVITRGQGEQAGAILCSSSSPTIAHCLVVGNRATDPNGAAICCADSDAVFINCTVADNCGRQRGGGFHVTDGNVVLVNSIVWDNTPNQMVTTDDAGLSIGYSDVAGGFPALGNLNVDPAFVRPGYWADPDDPDRALTPNDPSAVWIDGDYHLKSQTGRWDRQTQSWVADETTSPCIDAGDPLDSVGLEPAPNGGAINMGAYGGALRASKSPSL